MTIDHIYDWIDAPRQASQTTPLRRVLSVPFIGVGLVVRLVGDLIWHGGYFVRGIDPEDRHEPPAAPDTLDT